jgi:hypothetical protein
MIEITSKSTRREDLGKKMTIYRDILRVQEYFLFDPFGEYLEPRLQGYQRRKDEFMAIRSVKDRLPSKVLGLHLEADAEMLRFYDPAKRRRLPIPPEVQQAFREERDARRRAEAEIERLRRELEELRRRL